MSISHFNTFMFFKSFYTQHICTFCSCFYSFLAEISSKLSCGGAGSLPGANRMGCLT